MTDPTPLQLATTDEIMEELRSRFRAMIFMGLKADQIDEKLLSWKIRTYGSPFELHGMARFIYRSAEETFDEIDQDDEDFDPEDV